MKTLMIGVSAQMKGNFSWWEVQLKGNLVEKKSVEKEIPLKICLCVYYIVDISLWKWEISLDVFYSKETDWAG